MAKLRKNFRLSTEALSNLERLSGLWGCDHTAVVERALAEADPSHMDLDERSGTQAALEEPSTPPTVSVPEACPQPVRQTSPTRFRQEIKKPEWKK